MTGRVPRLRSAARTLLAIDQPVLIEIVKGALGAGPFDLLVTPKVDQAVAAVAGWRPQLMVVDIDSSGGAFLDRLGPAASRPDGPPVIALTRRGDLGSKLAAFERGVDDVLIVPFSTEELVARVLALMRRTYRGTTAFMPALRIGELEIDIFNRRVRAGGRRLHLTSVEQSLLYLLAANAGRLVTRDEILDQIWGVDFVAGSNLVDRHIHNLRSKLRDGSQNPRCILTVPGRGYRFVPLGESEGLAPLSDFLLPTVPRASPG